MEITGLACAISALLLTSAFFVVHAQQGFISVDCGKPADYSSNDTRAVLYTSDTSYVDTGENRQISLSISAATSDPKLQDLRSFPEGRRNCYSLPVITKERSYLVRAYFLYGNYDGLDAALQFDLYLGTNLWSKVSISNSSSVYVHEMIAYAVGNSIQVCLVNTNSGWPFVSALELRPFSDYSLIYPADSSQSLTKVAMIDCGGQSPIRYPDDEYDRIWTPFHPSGSTTLSSSDLVEVNQQTNVPSKVMQTAATPTTGYTTLNFSWPVDESRGPLSYLIAWHFAELQNLTANESRIFNFLVNGKVVVKNSSPTYLQTDSWYSPEPHLYSKLEFSSSTAISSSLPPIINAMEIFEVRYLEENSTDTTDVKAMLEIKKAYQLQKNWIGDPCAPRDFRWDGLLCNYDKKSCRIVGLNLSNSGLVGTLPTYLANLTELQSLDLSSNKLSGDIPEFLAELSNLKFLNLKYSGFSGCVPKALQTKVDANSLDIIADPCLRTPDVEPNPLPRKNQTVKVAVASVVGSVLLLLVFAGLIFWWWKRHHKTKPAEASTSVNATPSELDCRLFRYKELVRMTNNFSQLLGKGGSCLVFLGHLDNGAAVAVKKLSESSSKQFKDEVEVLKAINHRHLITLIGYCEDKRNLALVYEYMPRGSLADQLSVGSYDGRETLSWRDRVRIAYEAAQGLEYLHHYSRKAVIHRDVKSTNILLAADNGARISDFGISKTINATRSQGRQSLPSTGIVGTPGYVDPEYMGTGTPTEKSDVYSFGVILLELITGLPAIITNENTLLVHWVDKQSQTADLDKIVDRRLKGYNQDSIWAMLELALNCTRAASLGRPTMREVVAQLKDCLAVEGVHGGDGGLSPHSSATGNDSTTSFGVPPVIMTEGGGGDGPSPR